MESYGPGNFLSELYGIKATKERRGRKKEYVSERSIPTKVLCSSSALIFFPIAPGVVIAGALLNGIYYWYTEGCRHKQLLTLLIEQCVTVFVR